MRWMLVLLCGCGRFAFDPASSSDAVGVDVHSCLAVGHDEDIDGIDDACDVCPHRPDPLQADHDGDGVGDACDPRPDFAGEHIVFFDSFANDLGTWQFTLLPAAQSGDVLTADTRLGQLMGSRPAALTTDRIEMSGHLGAIGSGQRQVLIEADSGSSGGAPPSYYCEIGGDDMQSLLALTYTPDFAGYNVMFTKPFMASFVSGDFYLRIDTTPTTVGCGATWPGAVTEDVGLPPALVPTYLGFRIQGFDATVNWIIQIHSD